MNYFLVIDIIKLDWIVFNFFPSFLLKQLVNQIWPKQDGEQKLIDSCGKKEFVNFEVANESLQQEDVV